MLRHQQLHRRQIKDLAALTSCHPPMLKRLTTTATLPRSMDHYLVRLADLCERRPAMMRLPASFLSAALAQAPSPLLYRRVGLKKADAKSSCCFSPAALPVPALCALRQMSGGVLYRVRLPGERCALEDDQLVPRERRRSAPDGVGREVPRRRTYRRLAQRDE
jgi:hypothetical protein